MELAPPAAFEDLRPLVLGDHALDLQQQILLIALPQAMVEKHHLHATTSELVEQ
jgi:hypothetical protein